MIRIPNKKIACTPFESLAIQKTGTNFITAKQKSELMETKVLFPDTEDVYEAGQRVFIRGDAMTLPWTREVFEFQGTKFILVPMDAVQMVVG